ncbi:MAG: TIGR03936 family radical SAM-associated protein [Coriobacteriales bacterium]|nr:TIGR03936 family radical SAM-associated protein [Coriobacteriales bacterium]
MAEPTLFCLRVRYRETGRLRYLSHLELLRALERLMRRAQLPYAVTQGFSPRIKASYGPALPVGVASNDEWFDVWLQELRPASEYLERLRAAAPSDLMPLEAAYVDTHAPSLSASLVFSSWEATLGIWPDVCESWPYATPTLADIEAACQSIVHDGSLTYMRNGKPKTVDLEHKLERLPQVSASQEKDTWATITFTTRASNEGALRPDVFLDAVAMRLTDSLTVQGAKQTEHVLPDSNLSVSSRKYFRIAIVRLAQYLEGEDGEWVRPMQH